MTGTTPGPGPHGEHPVRRRAGTPPAPPRRIPPRTAGPNRRWAWLSLALGLALMTGVQLAEARTATGAGDFVVAATGASSPPPAPDPVPIPSSARPTPVTVPPTAPSAAATPPATPDPAASSDPATQPAASDPATSSDAAAQPAASDPVITTDAPVPAEPVTPTEAPDPASPAAQSTAPVAAGIPVGFHLPRFDVRAPVDPVGLSAGELEVPEDVTRLGWWTGSTAAGGPSGTTVLDGHIDSPQGRGVFFHLQEVEPDDEVVLTVTGGATVTYRVTERRSYHKADGLPAEVFASTEQPRLVLITCGGRYDHTRASYDDNIVVIAVPA